MCFLGILGMELLLLFVSDGDRELFFLICLDLTACSWIRGLDISLLIVLEPALIIGVVMSLFVVVSRFMLKLDAAELALFFSRCVLV